MYNDNKYIRMTIDALRGEGLPNIRFNMDYVFSRFHDGCDTSACIAGYIAAFNDKEHGTNVAAWYDNMPLSTTIREVGEMAGMTNDEARRLFYPEELTGYLEYVAADDAADVLERYAETGVIDWSAAVAHVLNR
jgi:hypothetical protein